MKKVGLLISTLNSGGAERVVSHLSHILSEKYDIHVVLFEDKYIEYDCGGTVHNLDVPAKGASIFAKLKLLRKRVKALKDLIKEERLDCVISFLDSPNFVNLLARVKGCRKIISIRNYSGLENKRSFLGLVTDKIMKRLYKRADHVVTVSKLIEQDFKLNYNIPANKISAIYNPYNFAEITEKAAEPLSDSEALFYKDKFVFCNVGRIMYQKGVWHLLKAFSLLKESNPSAALIIVGEDFSDGKLEKLAAEFGISDSVLLTGRTKNPYKYMRNANCYVLSSLFEGFPNSMVEAMACGCPIIAADCKSGPREILFEKVDLQRDISELTDADFGIVVPDLEHDECWDAKPITDGEKILSNAMYRLMNEKSLCAHFSQKALDRSRAFSFSVAFERFASVIEDFD